MAPKKEDPVERLTGMIEAILDKREQRKAEEKDPKAKFDRLMERLEGFLDGMEEGESKERKPKPEKKEGGVISALFGEQEETG
jgi:hypothetical protein